MSIKNLSLLFPSMSGYRKSWLRSDIMAALVVTAIAIPESLGFAVIVGLPVQAGLYCALLAPIIFAAFTSSKRLVVGADSATAALVAAGAASVATVGTVAYGNAIAVLGIVTAAILLAMALARFGFMADLISRPVLIGFISGVGVQLLIGKLPEMLGMHVHGTLLHKLSFVATHLGSIGWPTALLSGCVVAIVVAGWKYRYPGALLALVAAIVATKLFNLQAYDIDVVGTVPAGLPSVHIPEMSLSMISALLPIAFSIAVVILAQSLAVIRSSAARHEEKVRDNQDLMALGLANAASAMIGGFAINGSPPRTSAGELAGGRSQLVNVIMSLLIGVVLVLATGLFAFVPAASLAAIVFTIGLHLLKIDELKSVWRMSRSESIIALVALVTVALMGVQKGVMLAVLLSLIERLRRQYHPYGEVLVRDQQYAEWAADRFVRGRHPLDAPGGLLAYRFNDALFFENAGYFMEQVTRVISEAKEPVKTFVLDASAISDIDYTAAQTIGRVIAQLDADDVQFCVAHASPHLRKLLKRYGLLDLVGQQNVYPNLRFAIEAYGQNNISKKEYIERLHLAQSDYVVIGGSVMELFGIRDTNDVDLVVSQEVYDDLQQKGWKEFVHDDGKRLLTKHGYRIMLQWMGRDLGALQANATVKDGIVLMSLDDLIECKVQLGRKKDLQDVAALRSYIAKQHKLQRRKASGKRLQAAAATPAA